MSKVKIGFVGYGYWGKNILRNLVNIKDVEVIAVCDMTPANLKKAKELYPDIKEFTDSYDTLVKNIDIDAIVIATPPDTHYDLALKALKANKHLFVEKPLATNSKKAKKLVSLAKTKKKVLMTGHTFIYNPALNDVKRLIQSGELGQIHYIDFVMTNLGKYQKYNVLWDLAPHGISIILYLLDNPEITRVEVNGISAIKKDLLDVAYLTLYYESGFATIHFSWLNPDKVRKLTIVGSKKMIVFDDIAPLEKIRIYDKGIEKEDIKGTDFSSWGESIVGYRHGSIIIPVSSTGEPLGIEMRHFIYCILNKKEPITNGKQGLKVVEIIEEANERI